MAEGNRNIQEKLNELKQLRKTIYDNSKNSGALIFNKVELLGEGENTGKELYRVIEEYSIGENRTEIREFFYEFEDVPKLIAVRYNGEFDDIIPAIDPGIEGTERENWDLELLDIEMCLEEKEVELKELAKMLGIDEEEINSLSEIDLEQRIGNKELENREEREHEEGEDKPKQISDEEAKTIGINGMNSARMDAAIDTKGNTLGKELGLEEYDSILVVHSYKLSQLNDAEGKKGQVNNINFALIGKKKDGTLEIIPYTKLRPYRGANREVTEINNREEVEVKNEECIFEVPNSHKRIAINQKDPYGIPEIYYGKSDRENDGNVMQNVQDERDGTQRKNVEVRALFNSNKGEYQIDKMDKEVKDHIKAGCNDIGEDEVDGDTSTGHWHFDPNSQEQQEAISLIIEQSGAGPDSRISRQEAERLFVEKIEETEGKLTPEEVAEIVIDEMNGLIRGHNM